MTKSEIRHLIADGQLQPAAQFTLEYAEKCQLAEPVNALTALSGSLKEHQMTWNSGQISYEELNRFHARSAHAIMEWLHLLPDTPTPASRTRMLDEYQYKWRIFWIFVIAKLIVLGRLWYHWNHGGFTRDEFLSTLMLLGAALTAHAVVMFDNLLQSDNAQSMRKHYVSSIKSNIVQGLVVLYALGLFMAIEFKAMTNLSFAEMNTMITLVETLLGGYVGKVVARFFRSEKN